MWSNLQFSADLVTFTEEILTGKLHFLCAAIHKEWHSLSIEATETNVQMHTEMLYFGNLLLYFGNLRKLLTANVDGT